VGRDPSEIELSTHVSTHRAGGIQQDVLEKQLELGVTLFEASTMGPDFALDHVVELLKWRDSLG